MEGSPLLKLSPEIRNDIYELALRHGAAFLIGGNRDFDTRTDPVPKAKVKDAMGLTMVCSKVRNECLQLFYAVNRFKVKTEWRNDSPFPAIRRFQAAIGRENASALRHIRVTFADTWRLQTNYDDLIAYVTALLRLISQSPSCSLLVELLNDNSHTTVMFRSYWLEAKDGQERIGFKQPEDP